MRRDALLFILLGIILSVTAFIVISMYGVSSSKVTEIAIADTASPEKPFVSLDYKRDKEDVGILVKAIRSGKKVKGKLDIRQPDYIVTISMKNGKKREYSLWLENKSGTIMYNKDPGTGYKLSQKAAKDIKSVIGRYEAALCKAAFPLFLLLIKPCLGII